MKLIIRLTLCERWCHFLPKQYSYKIKRNSLNLNILGFVEHLLGKSQYSKWVHFCPVFVYFQQKRLYAIHRVFESIILRHDGKDLFSFLVLQFVRELRLTSLVLS